MSIHESEFTPGRLFRSVPPARKIAEAFRIDLPLAKRIRGILRGEIDPRSVPETDRRCRQCYHEPEQRYQAEHAVGVLLDMPSEPQAVFDPRHCSGQTLFTYLGAGDTYDVTLVFTGDWPCAGRVEISTFGDYLEHVERRERIRVE